MKKEIIKFVKKSHEEWDFKYHIIPAVKNALILAEKLKADKEVVELAAYLHDIGRIIKYDQVHDEKGAIIAEKMLKKYGYKKEIRDAVIHCIKSHRVRKNKPKTKEAKIIASADAMSHFDTFPILFPVFFKAYKDSYDKTLEKVFAKIERDWKEKLIFPEAKKMMKEKYEAIKKIIKSTRAYI